MLGSGTQFNVNNFKTNVKPYINLSLKKKIKFIFSAGIAGGDIQLNECVNAIKEIAYSENWNIKLGIISGEVEKELLISFIESGVETFKAVDSEFLKDKIEIVDVEESEHIVSQMGPEPIIEMLKSDVDGIITGRALDIGLYMAPCIFHGFDKGLSAHLGKILECAGLALTPGDPSDPIVGEICNDKLLISSVTENQKATIRSISGHSLYERDNPFMEKNPGGYLDIGNAVYKQISPNVVSIEGSKWIDEPYTLKIEGAKNKGFRSISLFGIREPRFIDVIDEFLNEIIEKVKNATQFNDLKYNEDYFITFDQYGKNGVYGKLEPSQNVPHEIGLLVDVIAPSQSISENLLYYICMELWIKPYKNRLTTAGNCATRFAPPIIKVGSAYNFNIWHLIKLDDPLVMFKSSILNLNNENT